MSGSRWTSCSFPACSNRWRIGDGHGVRTSFGCFCDTHFQLVRRPAGRCDGCDRPVATQRCGPCDRRLCAGCYGEWNALACRECKEKARRHVQTAQ